MTDPTNRPAADIPDELDDARTYEPQAPPGPAEEPPTADASKPAARARRRKGPIEVTLRARPTLDTEHGELNSLIRYQLEATSFSAYKLFMDKLTGPDSPLAGGKNTQGPAPEVLGQDSEMKRVRRELPDTCLPKVHGVAAYELLRAATSAWLLTRCGPICADPAELSAPLPPRVTAFLDSDAERYGLDGTALTERLTDYLKEHSGDAAATPYLSLIVRQIIPTLPPPELLDRVYRGRWNCPLLIELIWSYWHEEGMLCQTMNAIALRFQNRKSRAGRDPLANLAIDPLRPLSNLLWGWLESAYKRLTVERRAYQYDSEYGLSLVGKAVPPLLSADSRSNFLEAFHSLLHITHLYYGERADTTRVPDGFPLLNALRHVHLILAEGAHNQYGDLPWTSRVEMLVEMWLLARPEMREFLRGRAMVPYQETWMPQVDTMKKLQMWTDVTVTHFHELATCGEAILLAVRHGPWASTNDQEEAKTWADYWRPEIQRYIYAYKAATGADLTLEPVSSIMPGRLLHARFLRQQAAGAP
jgi:hypothetical protein